jgi:Holin of 3TMs, for gene-transfer release
MGISLKDVLGSSLLDSVKGIIQEFHMSPEDKAKLTAQIDAEKDQFETAEKDYNTKLNDIAGQNIRAEEQSGDKFTARARPAVIWVGLLMFFWNYCFVPSAGIHWHIPSLPIPDTFSEIWGVVVTGYVFNRTVDKVMALPGDSSIKLPFGIQIANKS